MPSPSPIDSQHDHEIDGKFDYEIDGKLDCKIDFGWSFGCDFNFDCSIDYRYFCPHPRSILLKIKNNFLTECRIWQSLRHPHVVQLLKVCCDPPLMGQSTLPIIVMEEMHLNLRGLVEKHSNIPMNVKTSILNDVCLGLRYLHSHNPPIIHRDLTPNNVLLTCGLVAKISDMGVAKVLRLDDPRTMTEAPGTADFMPPESLAKRPSYGLSLDVFSFGAVVLYTTTQLWPTPAPWVEIDSKRNSVYLSEVE